MIYYDEILSCLSEKYACFLSLEELSIPMQYETVGVLEELMIKRGELFEKISQIDAKLHQLTQNDEYCRRVIALRVSRKDISLNLRNIYHMSLQCKLSVNRLLKNEDVIRLHLENEKQRVMEQVKELNQNGSNLAARYHFSVQTGKNRTVSTLKNRLI